MTSIPVTEAKEQLRVAYANVHPGGIIFPSIADRPPYRQDAWEAYFAAVASLRAALNR